MYIFGSKLIKKIFPDFREPNDEDWVTNIESEMKESIIGKKEYYYIPFTPDREMTADEIYTVKVSHAIYDIKWQKTMTDIRFLQIKGCQVIPEFLTKLREFWIKVHGVQKRVDFDIESDKLFKDNVKREIPHDDLHLMLNPNPTYLKMVDGIKPNKEKFTILAEEEKKELLFEESFVIAIERFASSDRLSYKKAQQILVTRLHPIWLADFIILNWNKWYWIPTNSKFYNNFLKINNNK